MAKRTVKELLEAGLQVTPEALSTMLANPNLASLVISRIRDAGGALVLTEDDIKKIVEEGGAQKAASINTPSKEEEPKATPILELKPALTASEVDEEFEVVMDPTRVIGTSGTLDDFVNYFKDRYMRLSNLLLKRGDVKGAHKTSEVGKFKEARVIGIVKEISKVRSGSMTIELEDLDGTVSVLIPVTLADKARNLMLDQVVCVEGKKNGSYIVANNIIWPDIPFDHKPRRANDPVIAVFISDTHFGSKKFMEKPFVRFIEWLRGERGDEKIRALTKQVKYLVIGGDIVDGVGVYPDQEKELAVEELYTQYEVAASYLERIPDYVKIIAIPGGHDATRQALPQPAIPREYGEPLYEIGVEVLGDPAYFKIHGVEVLCFHGDSLNDVMATLSIDPHHPEKAMVELLRGRHLAPIYGSTPISPEPIDLLVIERVPDVFHCGHLHVNGQENYRGVVVINSGTFQDQTDYQRSMGLTPTPGRPYIINLKDFWVAQLDFTGD
ncbi:MAG: DNA-directed DNA polymerase II small subunit [Candidatus Freyarchaeota archaeon]|nr:DNA-directed DNA polymerase II small subunit [Candidatus Jordarchaeia archaeon]